MIFLVGKRKYLKAQWIHVTQNENPLRRVVKPCKVETIAEEGTMSDSQI